MKENLTIENLIIEANSFCIAQDNLANKDTIWRN
jgi:hypothetical protein